MSLLLDELEGLNSQILPTMKKISFTLYIGDIRQEFGNPMQYYDITTKYQGIHQLYTRIVHPVFCASFNRVVDEDEFPQMQEALFRLQTFNQHPELANEILAILKGRVWEVTQFVRKDVQVDEGELLRLCLILFRVVVSEITCGLLEMVEDARNNHDNVVGFNIVDHPIAEIDNSVNPVELYITLTTGTIIE